MGRSKGATDRRPIAPMPPDLMDDFTRLAEPPSDLRASQLREQLLSRLDLSGRGGAGLQVADSRMEVVDFSAADLTRALVVDAVVDGGSWANTDLSNATLKRLEMRGVRLTGVILAGAKISDARFVNCRMDMSSLRFAHLERVRFEDCRMEEADLYEGKLESVVFTGCDLRGASFAQTRFVKSEMRGCDLDGIGSPERLSGVGMPWPDIVRAAAVLAAAVGIHVVDSDD